MSSVDEDVTTQCTESSRETVLVFFVSYSVGPYFFNMGCMTILTSFTPW